MAKTSVSIWVLLMMFLHSNVIFAYDLPTRKTYQKRPASIEEANEYYKFKPTLSYDLSFSFGQYGQTQYSEATLGLNWRLKKQFIWRNALFSRFQNIDDSPSGLDSIARFELNSQTDIVNTLFFIGPGLRFASSNQISPIGEVGLILKIGGMTLGGGAKLIFYDQPKEGYPSEDIQYFIILSGSGDL